MPMVRTPIKKLKYSEGGVGFGCQSRIIRATPRGQVIGEALVAPPVRLARKCGYRFRAGSMESPSKPSRARAVRPESPELAYDDDTLSDDSGSSVVSPGMDLSVTPPDAGLEGAFSQGLASPQPLKDYLLSSALLHSQLMNDGALHEGPAAHSETNQPDILPLFRTQSKKSVPASSTLLPHRQRRTRVLKSILKRPSSPDVLNFLVSATNGSLVDATIFATEINSCSNEVPLPTTIWEKVTIPVNVEIRDKFKKSRAKLIGGYYDDANTTDDENNASALPSSGKDAAVIRGYEWGSGNENAESMEKGKTLKWAKA